MKKVLAVIHPPEFGGPHNQVLQLRTPLIERGWNTLVVLPDEAIYAGERLRSAGLDVFQIPLHRLRAKIDLRLQFQYFRGFVPEIKELRRIIREHNIDLVQVCGLMNPHSAIAAKLENVPVVWQLLGTTAPMVLRFLLMPFVTQLSDVIMVTGTRVARLHPRATSFGNRLIIFFPPVNSRKFYPDNERRMKAREDLCVPQESKVVGTIGNFNKLKGHDIFIEAIAMIIPESSETYFRILGAETPSHAQFYERNVKAKAFNLGLMDDGLLQFVNPGDRVDVLLSALDIFVLTSRAEGIPTVVLEAMATGLPVVTNDIGSVSEVLKNNNTGIIVRDLAPNDIASAILSLLNDPSLRSRLGSNARQYVIDKFDVNVCADIHLQAYQMAREHLFQN